MLALEIQMTKVESDDSNFSGIVILAALLLGRFSNVKEMLLRCFVWKMREFRYSEPLTDPRFVL